MYVARNNQAQPSCLLFYLARYAGATRSAPQAPLGAARAGRRGRGRARALPGRRGVDDRRSRRLQRACAACGAHIHTGRRATTNLRRTERLDRGHQLADRSSCKTASTAGRPTQLMPGRRCAAAQQPYIRRRPLIAADDAAHTRLLRAPRRRTRRTTPRWHLSPGGHTAAAAARRGRACGELGDDIIGGEKVKDGVGSEAESRRELRRKLLELLRRLKDATQADTAQAAAAPEGARQAVAQGAQAAGTRQRRRAAASRECEVGRTRRTLLTERRPARAAARRAAARAARGRSSAASTAIVATRAAAAACGSGRERRRQNSGGWRHCSGGATAATAGGGPTSVPARALRRWRQGRGHPSQQAPGGRSPPAPRRPERPAREGSEPRRV